MPETKEICRANVDPQKAGADALQPDPESWVWNVPMFPPERSMEYACRKSDKHFDHGLSYADHTDTHESPRGITVAALLLSCLSAGVVAGIAVVLGGVSAATAIFLIYPALSLGLWCTTLTIGLMRSRRAKKQTEVSRKFGLAFKVDRVMKVTIP